MPTHMAKRWIVAAQWLGLLCVGADALRLVGRLPSLRVTAAVAPRHYRCCMQADLPISDKSTLADLRAFISERGLDVKTTGKGRTKKVIYSELVAMCSSDSSSVAASPVPPAPAAPPAPPADAPVAAEAAAVDAAAVPKADKSEAEDPMGTAPDGFQWGGTF